MIFKLVNKFKNIMDKLIIKTILFVIFELIMTVLIPFLDFFIGVKYFNDITCDSDTFIKMSLWLILKGIIASISTITIFIIIVSGKNSLVLRVSRNTLIIFNIILALWLILGGITFWESCLDLKPINVDIYIWFSILFGIFYITNLKLALNFGDKIDTIPLLDAHA
jgi:uncharacterized membrane protein